MIMCKGLPVYMIQNEQRNVHFLYLMKQSELPVVLVARTTLGTINQTMLSLEALKMNEIPIAGIVFNAFEGTELE